LKKRKDVMEQISLYEQVKNNLKNTPITLVNSVMDIFDDIVT
jgi:GTP1/Obg family GTP-binding protein